MTYTVALTECHNRLASAGIDAPRLESEVLLMFVSGFDRNSLYVNLNELIPLPTSMRLDGVIRRRLSREPLAYITGRREFFGLDFRVDSRVLIPRQETETLVEEALSLINASFGNQKVRIADIGTGSGCIGISLAKHLPESQVFATDISACALQVAETNCQLHDAMHQMSLIKGDLLQPLPGPVDVIVANLPYIPNEDWRTLAPEIRLFEPKEALLSSTLGLDHCSRLITEATTSDHGKAWLLMEVGEGQANALIDLSKTLSPGCQISTKRDLSGIKRVLVIGPSYRRRQ
ncbi:peptide chain release factor N(5)-glutamine methyltransferase [Dehalococcoidia bacterium]|nr:peptide chain release factor N(5)-glutamine methyltransferase [Dehalococcoidia bacterium]